MCFQRNISLLFGRMEARRRAGGNGPVALVGGRPAATASRRSGKAAAARLGEGSRTPCLPTAVPGHPRDLADL
jgi:hypothetical protein